MGALQRDSVAQDDDDSARGIRIPAWITEGLPEEVVERIDRELSDEDKEWVLRVIDMTDEEARDATIEWRKRHMIEESNRSDYEHFLTQIP